MGQESAGDGAPLCISKLFNSLIKNNLIDQGVETQVYRSKVVTRRVNRRTSLESLIVCSLPPHNLVRI